MISIIHTNISLRCGRKTLHLSGNNALWSTLKPNTARLRLSREKGVTIYNAIIQLSFLSVAYIASISLIVLIQIIFSILVRALLLFVNLCVHQLFFRLSCLCPSTSWLLYKPRLTKSASILFLFFDCTLHRSPLPSYYALCHVVFWCELNWIENNFSLCFFMIRLSKRITLHPGVLNHIQCIHLKTNPTHALIPSILINPWTKHNVTLIRFLSQPLQTNFRSSELILRCKTWASIFTQNSWSLSRPIWSAPHSGSLSHTPYLFDYLSISITI